MVLLAVVATPAAADVGPQSWDGTNPFTCTLQDGNNPADPNADPFCIQYTDSLSDPQTVAGLLTNGPNQLAAAVNKCFIYRVDHFTSPLGEVDTAIFVNKATGAGGSAVTHSTIPLPASGGAVSVPVVQACGPAQGGGGGGTTTTGGGVLQGLGGVNPGTSTPTRPGTICKNRSGNANNGLGRAKLGLKRTTIARRFGKPTRRAHGFYHYCLRRGGDLAVHFGKGSKADVAMVSGKSFHAGKVKIGSRLARVRSSLKHEQVLGHAKRDWVLGVTHKHWRLLVGLSKNRVVYIAAVQRRLSFGKLGKILTNAGK